MIDVDNYYSNDQATSVHGHTEQQHVSQQATAEPQPVVSTGNE